MWDFPSPPSLLEAAKKRSLVMQMMKQYDHAAIAQVLLDQDYTALARYIEKQENEQMIVYAARLRVVLAKRTGDPAPLAKAREVFELLNDRLFLRRLEELEAQLQ